MAWPSPLVSNDSGGLDAAKYMELLATKSMGLHAANYDWAALGKLKIVTLDTNFRKTSMTTTIT